MIKPFFYKMLRVLSVMRAHTRYKTNAPAESVVFAQTDSIAGMSGVSLSLCERIIYILKKTYPQIITGKKGARGGVALDFGVFEKITASSFIEAFFEKKDLGFLKVLGLDFSGMTLQELVCRYDRHAQNNKRDPRG